MSYLLEILVILGLYCNFALGVELTFELPDNARDCFHEVIDKDVKCTIEFQVITGGNYDVDLELKSPSGQILYKDVKKQYDSFTWTTDMRGEYTFCFSNEFSTYSHKTVYFDFQVGEEKPLLPDMGAHAKALTQLESSAVTIHEAMKVVIDYQTHHRLREGQGRSFAEGLNERVQYWSIGQTVVILIIGIGQVLVLRSFFSDKKSVSVHT
ncbi:transmembrane emp24 domain-containing protein 3-like [Lingula anatina]|uniref:Transmembrane emp24 domain-containing protein 3 n=1 Tax=Lingula anatina TaxID=7574 RepID=A0A1S3I4Z1_LINAN|nr:transmembrane emp24 domain-containing protein 3 [Lingula anatina]XP_013421287.1 transmembrane emp24 domain-containing protein 3-like [Lingula anatina]|eukprot:XP_013392434.1 transmembrane emp24 domain-containing protein 3 [Lingula anatina]